MLKIDKVFKVTLLFFGVYLSLSLINLIPAVKNAHYQLYTITGQPIHNMINPHFFAEFHTYSGTEDYDFTYLLYDKIKHGRSVKLKRWRDAKTPRYTINLDIKNYFLVPSILLFSLFMATPGSWKRKLWSVFSGFFIFYIYLAIYIGHRFEIVTFGEQYKPETIWQWITKFIGGTGVSEQILLVVVIIWGVITFSPTLKSSLLPTAKPRRSK